jgi:hypothetical protein
MRHRLRSVRLSDFAIHQDRKLSIVAYETMLLSGGRDSRPSLLSHACAPGTIGGPRQEGGPCQ